MERVEFDGGFEGWRGSARALLHRGIGPHEIAWVAAGSLQDVLARSSTPQRPLRFDEGSTTLVPRVSRTFLTLARQVACHRDPGRWHLLYRALWRHARGEPHLLSVVTDPDVHPLLLMARAVRRASQR